VKTDPDRFCRFAKNQQVGIKKNQNLGNFEGGKIKPGWLDGETGHLTGFQSSIFEI
jgi:hypothetical protein